MKFMPISAMAIAVAATPVFANEAPVVVAMPAVKAPPTTLVITGSPVREVPPLPQVSYAFAAAQEAAKVADEAAKAARYADVELNAKLVEMAASLAAVQAELAQVKAQIAQPPVEAQPTEPMPVVDSAAPPQNQVVVEQQDAVADVEVQRVESERVLFPHLRQYMKARAVAEREERERAALLVPAAGLEAPAPTVGKRFAIGMDRIASWAGLRKATNPAAVETSAQEASK